MFKAGIKAAELGKMMDLAKVAWGITGCGDKLRETLHVMKEMKKRYGESVQIEVFLSKAGARVTRYYNITKELNSFNRLWEEKDAITPFLAGRIQLGQFKFLLVAPASSNTVAKIAVGIADSLLTNATIQAAKGFVPVYIMPVDYREGAITSTLPNGKPIKLRVRREDADNVRKLESMEGIHPFEDPKEIAGIFKKYLASQQS